MFREFTLTIALVVLALSSATAATKSGSQLAQSNASLTQDEAMMSFSASSNLDKPVTQNIQQKLAFIINKRIKGKLRPLALRETCRKTRMYFENCYWVRKKCPGRPDRYFRLSCPGLPR